MIDAFALPAMVMENQSWFVLEGILMVRALLEGMECFGLFRELAVTVDVSPLEVQGTLRSGERICFRPGKYRRQGDEFRIKGISHQAR